MGTASSEGGTGSEDGTTPSAHTEDESVDLARAMFSTARAEAKAAGASTSRASGQRSRAGRSRRTRVEPTVSGARPDDRDPATIGASVERLLRERGWEADAAVAGVMGRWDAIVGAEIADHVQPDRFDDGVLHVSADSTAWATQVRLLAPSIVRRLNDELGEGLVETVMVHGPSTPSWRKGALHVRGRGPRDTYG